MWGVGGVCALTPSRNPIQNNIMRSSSQLPVGQPHHVIEFDGGTTCNIPARGYGRGYGSFQVNDWDIVRVDHGPNHSCNSAEILTLVAALEHLRENSYTSKDLPILVRGDSQIALKWVHCKKNPKLKTSPMFRDAIQKLRKQVIQFPRGIYTEWRGRAHSVALFGH